MISCRVLLFARARELAGTGERAMTLPARALVAELRRQLIAEFPALGDLLPRCAIGINGEYATDAAPVPPDAEVSVLPPVSGG